MMSTNRLSAFVLAAVCVAAPAWADPISFDPDGTGPLPASTVANFSFLPGNVLADNVPQAPAGSFTLYYQTRVGALLDGGDQPINVPGLNDTFEITVVSQFDVSFSVVGSTINFGPPVPGTNQMRMYFDDNLNDDPSSNGAHDLSGTGFFDGTLIFDSAATSVGGAITAAPNSPVPFDMHETLNYPTTLSQISGSNGVFVQAATILAHADFFKTPGIQGIIIDSHLTSPFMQVDPSQVFDDGVEPDLGPANGSGEDIQLQSDDTASFFIPEPTTVGLIGMAILALVGRRQRQR